ncbi:class I SAM-dependent methyltransferase [Streptomyces sp. NPDC004539]|uniref:class I SAM-dependent methyltransferase n=1 Tax=Streptomyces sp. NPDC004539 TaxID=3154280 RepID=UPI0033B5AAA2
MGDTPAAKCRVRGRQLREVSAVDEETSVRHAGWEERFASGNGFREAGSEEMRRLSEAAPCPGHTSCPAHAPFPGHASYSGHAPHPHRALDVGCGLGTYAALLASLGWETLAVDWAESAVAAVRDRYADLEPRLSARRLDFTEPARTLPRGVFGLVTMRLVLAFLPDKAAVGERVRELLAPGGVWLVTTPLAERLPEARRAIGLAAEDVSTFTEGWAEGAWYDLEAGGLRCFVLRKERAAEHPR